jgi:hypothetical protein
MSAENIHPRIPSTKEVEKPEPVAVCLFEMPKELKKTNDGFIDADKLVEQSEPIQRTIKTSTEGGKALPVPDPFSGHRVPRGSRGMRIPPAI